MTIIRLQRQIMCHCTSDKRVGGIEPPSLAWKAKVLPLNYTRINSLFFNSDNKHITIHLNEVNSNRKQFNKCLHNKLYLLITRFFGKRLILHGEEIVEQNP